MDDPEHYDLSNYPKELSEKLKKLRAELERLIESADSGKVMKEGISTVILGRPNAGKSSLMNLLSGEERAIVTDIAGTTRDTLTEHIRLAGLSLNLTDTAGIHAGKDLVEKIGIERARNAAKEADLILLLIDSSEELKEDDLSLLREIENKNAIVLLNKSDLVQNVKVEDIKIRTNHPVIVFSAKSGEGLKCLEQQIKHMFYKKEINFNDQIYVTSVRHRNALEQAEQALRMVETSIQNGLPEDFFSIDLKTAYEALGFITGDTVEDDIVNRIFERFCTGK